MVKIDNITVARIFHEAWAERNPEKEATVISNICEFIDVPRGEL